MYSRIIKLRTKVPAYLPTFTTNNVDYNLGGLVKSQRIMNSALNIVVIGNFDVVSQTGSVSFPVTGNWQLYAHNVPPFTPLSSVNSGLSASGITISNTNPVSFNLPPGCFLLLVDRDAISAVGNQ
jgi:hypothetical protein